MLAQTLQNNKRGTVLASVLFLALLLYTWHSLRFESFLPAPLLNGGHRQVPIVSVRPREITCPARVGKQSKLQPAPAIRGRSGSAVHGETLSLPKVVALVFYGRRSTVSILDCYLKVNISPTAPAKLSALHCASLAVHPLAHLGASHVELPLQWQVRHLPRHRLANTFSSATLFPTAA